MKTILQNLSAWAKPRRKLTNASSLLVLAALALAGVQTSFASSHMDAPLITFDDPANLADVYAFLTERDGQKYLVVGLSTYPFEEPGIGPNKYNFDPGVLYEIHLSTGDDLATGADTISYQFQFETEYKTEATILQSYLGVIDTVGDASQNLVQTYSVMKVEDNGATVTDMGTGIVPPNNQGVATPKYNLENDGMNKAKPGVDDPLLLDDYTAQSIASLANGYRSFAGQREDGFYGDIQSIFDLLMLRSGKESFDSQSGFNTHIIMLEIPVEDIGGDMQSVGVYATTSRIELGLWTQVGRLGNPLFCEALVAIEDKNAYNQSKPTQDVALFQKYAETPELAGLINALVFGGEAVAPTDNRTDLVGIFIPDLIRVDLSTRPARLQGGSGADEGFSRLGIFGGDTLLSQISDGFGNGTVPGGWPNGRRFGDDVIDIAITAVISDLRTDPLTLVVADGIDNVNENDAIYNKVFPYAGTPHNGRNSVHNPSFAQTRVTRLVNMSTRGFVSSDQKELIGGLVIFGDKPVDVLLRALGPSLIDSGITDPLDDPIMTVFQGDEMIVVNDDWMNGDRQEEIAASPLAPADSRESAVLITLNPGIYTTVISGKDGAEGVGLAETYLFE
ncbi:MAG: DUF4331 domain-containing protein [Verrucomicrobia bacterium]|nr:DUF4331 domain-containing protein [Verrucomicrobiota bacterium]